MKSTVISDIQAIACWHLVLKPLSLFKKLLVLDYVITAKMLFRDKVGIYFLVGPSEAKVLVDKSCNPEFVAFGLIA